MSKQNRATLKQKVADFINRVAPFTDPLIQKTEDNEIRDDFADSQIFRDSTVGTINNPSAAFGADFVTNDEYDIDTSSSIPSDFVITLSNLSNNETGKLNIIKKTTQKFSFGNAVILPYGTDDGQAGEVFLSFLIHRTGGVYYAVPMFETKPKIQHAIMEIGDWNMDTTSFKIISFASEDFVLSEIRDVRAMIRNDNGLNIIPIDNLGFLGTADVPGTVEVISGTNIQLARVGGGKFDNTSYNQTSFNRGWLTVTYQKA